MRAFVPLLALVDATSTDCDLSGSPLFKQLSNGKYKYADGYKFKFAKKYKVTGQTLGNSGKMKQAKALLTHKSEDAEYSDGWLACSRNRMVQSYVRCNSDGTFTVDGKSGDDIEMPNCDMIGCDLMDLGNFYKPEGYTKADGCKKGNVEVDGVTLELEKNNCYRTCGGDENAEKSSKKILCECNWVSRTCKYRVRAPKVGLVDWPYVDANGEEVAGDDNCPAVSTPEPTTPEPTTPEPTTCGAACATTDPPTTEPPVIVTEPVTEPAGVWGQWGDWLACSAQCGEGLQQRRRVCAGEACAGASVETQSCTGPDGDCPVARCKVERGDLAQAYGKQCNVEYFRGDDGLYLINGAKCPQTTCKHDYDYSAPSMNCICSKKNVCQLKFSGKSPEEAYGENGEFSFAENCNAQKAISKIWRWAYGRRSAAQPESDVSGGADWTLQETCYADDVGSWEDAMNFHTLGFAPFSNYRDFASSTTYGKVVELDDGRLVCRHSNKAYDWQHDSEIYWQLSLKNVDGMNWLPISRFFWKAGNTHNHIATIRGRTAVVPMHEDDRVYRQDQNFGFCFTYSCYEGWGIRWGYGEAPSYRALCRVQDDRDGSWHQGTAVHVKHRSGDNLACQAFTPDGTKLYSNIDQPDSAASEFLAYGILDDGSSWSEWGEWSACSETCRGWYNNPAPTKTRQKHCLNSAGEMIEAKDGANCLGPASERHETKDCDDDEWTEGCPTHYNWSEWGECSDTCGGGTRTRYPICECGKYGEKFNCIDGTHPLIAGKCEDISCKALCPNADPRTGDCNTINCPIGDGSGLAEGDGVGLGCYNDGKFSLNSQMTCMNTADPSSTFSDEPSNYENALGFVPHNYACFSEGYRQCYYWMPFEAVKIPIEEAAVCNCHEGECAWTSDKKQDCSPVFEWAKIPSTGLPEELKSKVVDFNDPTSDSPQTAILAKQMKNTRDHRTPAGVADIDNAFSSEEDRWVLTHQCETGSFEWRDGPYTEEDCPVLCTGNDEECSDSWDWNGGWLCRKDYQTQIFFSSEDYIRVQPEFSHKKVMVFGLCRYQKEDGNWDLGRLIQHKRIEKSTGWWTTYTRTERLFKCCPHDGDENTVGCRLEFNDQHYLNYQVMFTDNCLNANSPHWSDWSEWSACTKECNSGTAIGERKRTRTCRNGVAGQSLGCQDSNLVEISEPCGLAQRDDCSTKGCSLDMHQIDFNHFRLYHTDYSEIDDETAFWQGNAVFYNRENDWYSAPKDFTGHFPEGTMVASYVCLNGGTTEDATCVCDGDDCNWDREFTSCTAAESHPGYKWTIDAVPEEGSYCASTIHGALGIVQDGECFISMAADLDDYYKKGKDANLLKFYKSFNAYYDGDETSKSETEFYTMNSECSGGFQWAPVEQADMDLAVETPVGWWGHANGYGWGSTWQGNTFYWRRTEVGYLCKMTYADGKSCYGKYVNGTCGATSTDSNSDSYRKRRSSSGKYADITVEILIMDQSGCEAGWEAWSECSDEGFGANCGPGTQTRSHSDGRSESRSCVGVCTEQTFCSSPGHSSKTMNAKNFNHMAAYHPLQKSYLTNDKVQYQCDQEGWWATDYITGDEYYALPAGAKCKLSCDQGKMHYINAFGNRLQNGEKYTVECESNGHYNVNDRMISNYWRKVECLPSYCVIPKSGWKSKNMKGTKVHVEVECGDEAVDAGDVYHIPKGEKCWNTCRAENGDAFRIGTQYQESFTCDDPFINGLRDECDEGDCLADFIEKGFELDNQSSEWLQQTSPSLKSRQQSEKHMKCYQVIDDSCDPATLDQFLSASEIAIGMTNDDISWTCANNALEGTSCTKTCGDGYRFGRNTRDTVQCSCTSSCSWTGKPSNCESARCFFQSFQDPDWPRLSEMGCKTADGSDFAWSEGYENGFDIGTTCKQTCKEHHIYEIRHVDQSTCECEEGGRCMFDEPKISQCIPGTCAVNPEFIFSEFEYGFDHPEAGSFYDPNIECDDLVPDDHPDSSVAGGAKENTKCYIKCLPGYHFVDFNGERFPITCRNTFDFRMEWDVFVDAWDRYGDCNGDYGDNCGDYPQCIPN